MSDGIAQNDLEVSIGYMYRVENLPAFADVEALRWKSLVGNDGEKIGTIETVERNEDTDRVEFLQIGRGGFLGFGAERFLVPVTAIVRVDEKHVYIDRPLPTLQDVPEYDHDRLHDPDYCAGVRAWWCEPLIPENPASQTNEAPA
jgi:sporulation protein YlmC with PRC-barrel domain